MRRSGLFSLVGVIIALLRAASAEDDLIDRLGRDLTFSGWNDTVRARISGLVDLEAYGFQQPPPGLIETRKDFLFNPRLTLFLDTEIGSSIYAFVQARFDRGFDPTDGGANIRLDEYAVRFHPFEKGEFSLQAGKFSTVVGSWVQRHDSWDNPFVNAPLPYENVTSVWDIFAPGNAETLLTWGHVAQFDYGNYSDKHPRLPIIWGPSYASGLAVSGKLGPFQYAAEVKNASLSSRPETWSLTETGFDHPTISARLGFQPDPKWNFGFSASRGPYLQPSAAVSLPPDHGIADYHEMVLGQDLSFAWHHLEIWAECFEARFEVPLVGDADTVSGYIEARYQLTPQLFGALRWNQQFYATVTNRQGEEVAWGNDVLRVDASVGYRFTPHLQLKLQYSLGHEELTNRDYHHLVAGQLTLKF